MNDTGAPAPPETFSSADPLLALHAEREAARAAADPNAELCWLATVDASGAPAVRTLVLRDVDGAFALFVNASSPKWRDMSREPRIQIVCWYASLQRQWRLEGQVRAFPHEIVARHWHRRPRVSQVLDHLYGTVAAQSTALEDDRDLEADLAALDATLPERPDVPVQSLALEIVPLGVECMQLRSAPHLHQRQRWHREAEDGPWTATRLVP